MSEPILIPEPIPTPIPIPELILIPKPISIPELIPIPEPMLELILEPVPDPIPESIPETDSGPTIRNRFQKISELARIDCDEIFIFPITNRHTIWQFVS